MKDKAVKTATKIPKKVPSLLADGALSEIVISFTRPVRQ